MIVKRRMWVAFLRTRGADTRPSSLEPAVLGSSMHFWIGKALAESLRPYGGFLLV